MDVFKQVVPYAASAFAIAVGLASVTAPPVFTLARDLAVAMIVGGFAGLGVSVVVPTVVRTARLAAITEESEIRRARARRTAPPKGQSEMVPVAATRTGSLAEVEAELPPERDS